MGGAAGAGTVAWLFAPAGGTVVLGIGAAGGSGWPLGAAHAVKSSDMVAAASVTVIRRAESVLDMLTPWSTDRMPGRWPRRADVQA
jgi:hypothetical protein